ncbi:MULTISPECIES: VOC family protein [Alcaligenes]|uniref:VOC family protein n=1 Tax=Alcaligenes TaxID=507 RepID=UPI000E9214FA|nr:MULTISPECIES: VOC family protein [Alcaligenes]MBQ0217876.1 VOC family protein [Alcaligenes faecalis]MBW4789750.1 VOC family protein [Alcaligenes faecalis subsp. faecalis]MBY6310208.1 VOC family protein [Alcaligenes faecalis]MBY6318917.1 VOC family protein [Alcaligenes faecalis]MBY6392819.1 VOC family protein [Alcaligenes faecalis]
MKFGYTIIYVPDVGQALDYFNRAFGLTTKMLHETGLYGELETGQTTLAFAAEMLAYMNYPKGHLSAHASDVPLAIEIALVCDDVPAAHAKALAEGGTELAPPQNKPWGQMVSYVQTPERVVVELCTPVK